MGGMKMLARNLRQQGFPARIEHRARLGLAAAMSFAMGLAMTGAHADAISDFYTGKTMTIIVGADSGGGYDAQGRLMSRHIAKFIPGNPTVIVQNMPGAGSLTAANQLYNLSPKDGTFMGLMQRGVFS